MIAEEYLIAGKTIAMLDDSSFVSSVSYMMCCDNSVYVAENKRSQILVLDTNLNLINVMGRSGRGPDELMDIGCFTIIGTDTVIVNDCGNNRLQVFNCKSGYVCSIPVGDMKINLIRGFLFDKDGILIGTAFRDSAHVCYKIDSLGSWNEIGQFGTRYFFNSGMKDKNRNDRYLLEWNNAVISISDNQPEFNIYNKNYELILNYNYAGLGILSEQINFINQRNLSENSYVVLVNSCGLYGNDLFILFNKFTPHYSSNMIIRFGLEKHAITSLKVYYLPDDNYVAFAVDSVNIYVFGTRGFQKFRYEKT